MIEYDVAISFAGEDRSVAFELASLLNNTYGLKVFYDDYEQAKMAGANLTEYLIDIYKNKSRYCVILISKHYKSKRWTIHEWRAAQARAFAEPDIIYFIPVRIDDTEIPGLLETVGYLSLKHLTIQNVARIIYDKMKDDIGKLTIIRTAQTHFANGEFNRALNLLSDASFDSDVDALRIRAGAYGKLKQYRKSLKEYSAILAILPDDFEAHFLSGIYNFRIGNFKTSAFHYRKAKEIYPDHPTIQSDLPAAEFLARIPFFKTFPWQAGLVLALLIVGVIAFLLGRFL